MTDPPEIYDPPRPKPRRAIIAAIIFNLLALILLLMGKTTAATVFVGLALVADVVAFGQSGSSGPRTPSRPPRQRPTVTD